MKKILSLLVVLTMALGLAACGSAGTETDVSQSTQPNSETEASVQEEETPEADVTQSDSTGQAENTDTNETKILVAYFSRTGENLKAWKAWKITMLFSLGILTGLRTTI